MFSKKASNMGTDKIIVIITGFLGIIFTYWFFLRKNEKEVAVKNEVDITVSGGYSPEVILVPRGKTTKINFIRTDPTDCLSEVVLPDFKIKKQLPLNKKVSVEITPEKAGEYGYACGMNMYHGKIVVK
ncbi:MAG: cupredoxin domain-containing protein [Patescibacteria group bacterium]|nr:cupredoxin domain-containing protein [Patescibacteria group bacterium]